MKNRIALVFPGQGSQAVGMGKSLYDNFKQAKETFAEASDSLSIDFRKLCFDDPYSKLNLTEYTQPALLTTSIAAFRSLESIADLNVIAQSGHSIGEYGALVASGSLKLTDALMAVRQRGQFMQEAVPVGAGAMAAAMGLDGPQAAHICKWVAQTVDPQLHPLSPANINSPGQVVLSGSAQAMDWLIENYKTEVVFENTSLEAPKRVKFIRLQVSAPFHCPLMKPAEDKMRWVLESLSFQKASQPIVQNYSATPETDPKILCENLIRQISAPVRWVECVEQLVHLEASLAIELGHGSVISGLIQKTVGEKLKVMGTTDTHQLKALEALL